MAPYFSLLMNISEVTEYLYLSGFAPVREENLKSLGITCVVDATNVPKTSPSPDVEYIKVAVDDNDSAKLDKFFDQVADKVYQHKLNGGKILIHCAAGISRSATLCLIYFVKHENMTLRDAYRLVHEKRPIISPNLGFWKQMIDYEKRNKNAATVKLIRARYREIPDVYLPSSTANDKENKLKEEGNMEKNGK